MTAPYDPALTAMNVMLERAEDIAVRYLKIVNVCPQTLFFWGVEGHFVMDWSPFEDQRNRWLYERGKVACTAAGAYASVHMIQAMVATPENAKTMGSDLETSRSPRQEEAVLILGETREGRIEKGFPVRRDEQANFIGLGDAFPYADFCIKDTDRFLTPEPPTALKRIHAKNELRGLGINLDEFRDPGLRVTQTFRYKGRVMTRR